MRRKIAMTQFAKGCTPIILALADDLTGALEVGAKFAAHCAPLVVTTQVEVAPEYPVVVIDTETRHLSEPEAAAAMRVALGAGARLIYKKTDSTLRANIAAELRALAAANSHSSIAYIPAYPALGRTVKNGHLYVHGIPVHQSSTARDILNPIADSSIARLLAGLPCTIHDGETDVDVARSVAATIADERFRIIAGPASVAEELVVQLGLSRQIAPRWPAVRTCLIVNGSLHDVSVRQIAFAEAQGCASVDAGKPWRILRPPITDGMQPLDLARQTGRLTREILDGAEWDALLVFGGDTAFGILKALACPPLEPVGEIVTGVPLSRVRGRDFCLITKAGGFGDEQLVCELRRILDGTNRE
jgi:uncharacterized protein YgbK (DUF1537 family)